MKNRYYLKVLSYDYVIEESVDADDFIFKGESIIFVLDVNGRFIDLAVYPASKTIIKEIRTINLD